MKILLKNIPPDGNSCMLYECEFCDLQGAPSCEEMADFLGKKKRTSQKNTKGTEALERQIERLEERIEVLEKIPMPAPLTQPYPWTPIGPIYCGDIPETINIGGGTGGKCNHNTFTDHSSSVPSGKIPIPSEEPLVFYVSAGSSFGKKPLTFHVNEKKDGEWRNSDDEGTIYNFDDKGKKISLKEQIERCEEKSALNRKVVLRENFC